MTGNSIAIDALGFFAKPFDVGSAISNFAFCFVQGLSCFGSQYFCQVFLVGHRQLKELPQDGGALLARGYGPGLLCRLGRVDGLAIIRYTTVRNIGYCCTVCWIRDRECLARLRSCPLSIDVGLLLQQDWVFENG